MPAFPSFEIMNNSEENCQTPSTLAAAESLIAAAKTMGGGSAAIAEASTSSSTTSSVKSTASKKPAGKRKAAEPLSDDAATMESALERKRRISRMSSKRLRDKQKYQLEDLQGRHVVLTERNTAIKTENETLRERIALIKANMKEGQQQPQQGASTLNLAAAALGNAPVGSLQSIRANTAAAKAPISGLLNSASARGMASLTAAAAPSNIPRQQQPGGGQRQIDDLTLQLLAAQRRQLLLQAQVASLHNAGGIGHLGLNSLQTAGLMHQTGLGSSLNYSLMSSNQGGNTNSNSNPLGALLALQSPGALSGLMGGSAASLPPEVLLQLQGSLQGGLTGTTGAATAATATGGGFDAARAAALLRAHGQQAQAQLPTGAK